MTNRASTSDNDVPLSGSDARGLLECEFCQGGPLECDCEDVDFSGPEATFDEAVESRRLKVIEKLGREHTETLLAELRPTQSEEAVWATLEQMVMWL